MRFFHRNKPSIRELMHSYGFRPPHTPHEKPVEGDMFEIQEPVLWLEKDEDADEIGIPSGFRYNGASIPHIAQWFVGNPNSAQFKQPALLHDWLRNNEDMLEKYSRKEAARIFYDALIWVKLINQLPKPMWVLRLAAWTVSWWPTG